MSTLAYGGFVKPGADLPNQARVIACRRESIDTYIVLAMWMRGRNDCEYVTWACDEKGECFWGHYFGEDILEATKDYISRGRDVP